jgi:uncharacterized protein (TIGR00270 family)
LTSLENVCSEGFKVLRLSMPIAGDCGGCDTMADCELCGAMKVGVKQVKTGRTEVAACNRCIEKLNLGPKPVAPGLARAFSSAPRKTSTNDRRGNNIMSRSDKDLADDFASRISSARKQKNWNQAQLGKRMAETVNVIKSAESGKRPTDSVIKKFERILGITLMVEHKSVDTRVINSGSFRGITLGDYLNKER